MQVEAKSPNITVNLGTFKTASPRREAYVKAAEKAGYAHLGAWIKDVLDKAAGFKPKEA